MTPERIEEIYGALDKMIVTLDPNPVSRGPLHMQDLISLTRGYLNEVGVYIQEAHRQRHHLEMSKEALEVVFQAESDRLLVEDDRVSGLPSIEDRRSMINLILREQRREIADVSGKLRAISLVEKALRFRHKELESTMSAIRVQRSLISMELGTGSIYGDESPTSRGSLWARKKSSSTTTPVAGLTPEDDEDLDEELARQMSELIGDGSEEVSSEKPEEVSAEEPEPTPELVSTQISDPEDSAGSEDENDTVSLDDDFDSFLMTASDVGQSEEEEVSKSKPEEKKTSKRPIPEEDPDVEIFLDEDEFSDFLSGI
jgi:hypothetical protein